MISRFHQRLQDCQLYYKKIDFTMELFDIASLLIVGAFWGCTNPFLRKGAEQLDGQKKDQSSSSMIGGGTLQKFLRVQVWLPYLLNQCGSLVYYILLSSSDLTVAVPICNGLALVFSCVTSYLLGERVDKPFQAMAGASCVVAGVAWCMFHSENISDDIS